MTHTETPGRSGISARFLSNFPGAAVPGLSGPCFGGQLRAVGTAPSRHLQAVAGFLSAGCASNKTRRALWAGGMASASALNRYTAASASHAPHESTWSLSNRMHTASGAVL